MDYHDSDSEAFVMDALGNRTGNQTLREDGAVNFAVDSATNRYTAIGGNSISHDEGGNLTVDKDGYKYSYDYENRVVKIQKPDGFGGWEDVAEMAYDALGRRIRVIDSVASATTLYYYNPEWQCLAEYNGAGVLQRYFIYGNYIDEPLIMHRQGDGEDYYYGQDHLYSTVVLLDDSGSAVERYEYDAYGTVLAYTDDGNDDTWFTGDDTTASASAKGNPYTFTGRGLDALDPDGQGVPQFVRMHYRHRDYDAYAGRFVQQDPLGQEAFFDRAGAGDHGVGLYEYCKSEPVQNVDSLGLLACDGGEWWFATKLTIRSALLLQYSSGPIHWTCQKRLKVADVEYECGPICVRTAKYLQPYAEGFVRSVDVILGLGGSWVVMHGTQEDAPDSEAVDEDSWHLMSVSVSAVIIGVAAGDDSGVGGGIVPGFGASYGFFGKTWNRVKYAYHKEVYPREDLNLMKRAHGGCKLVKYEPVNPPQWEESDLLDCPGIPKKWYE